MRSELYFIKSRTMAFRISSLCRHDYVVIYYVDMSKVKLDRLRLEPNNRRWGRYDVVSTELDALESVKHYFLYMIECIEFILVNDLTTTNRGISNADI